MKMKRAKIVQAILKKNQFRLTLPHGKAHKRLIVPNARWNCCNDKQSIRTKQTAQKQAHTCMLVRFMMKMVLQCNGKPSAIFLPNHLP